MVFAPTSLPNSKKAKTRHDLEKEIERAELDKLRQNEGEAAEYGIYYDDSQYDYMQHLRDVGLGANGVFLEAKQDGAEGKRKGEVKLEDALRQATIGERPGEHHRERLLDASILPSVNLVHNTYQSQQDVPDTIAGFQPDMDPRLREVLEALEDEAYVDDEDDIFGQLAKDREELSLEEFEESRAEIGGWEDEDEGWESDHTVKPKQEDKPNTHNNESEITTGADQEWMVEYEKFKQISKGSKKPKAAAAFDIQSSLLSSGSFGGGRRKKRKGALTSSSGYSMTSSSLARTEVQTILDSRFSKIEEVYAGADEDEDDEVSVASSAISAISQDSTRSDLDGIMDDFLGSYSMSGKTRVKRGGYQSGLEQLDEVRKGLGPARIRPQRA